MPNTGSPCPPAAVILAAGQGTRMKSDLPKVLHEAGGRPLVLHVLDACRAAGVEQCIVVVGHQAEAVMAAVGDGARFAIQAQRLGTGHAVMQAAPFLNEHMGAVLVACGDTPLLTDDVLQALLRRHAESGAAATILTTVLDDAGAYGRIVRGADGTVQRIVERKLTTDAELAIREINSGTYCFDGPALFARLSRLRNDNAQGEYLLTDVIQFLVDDGLPVHAFVIDDAKVALGVNTPEELAAADRILRCREAVKSPS